MFLCFIFHSLTLVGYVTVDDVEEEAEQQPRTEDVLEPVVTGYNFRIFR